MDCIGFLKKICIVYLYSDIRSIQWAFCGVSAVPVICTSPTKPLSILHEGWVSKHCLVKYETSMEHNSAPGQLENISCIKQTVV